MARVAILDDFPEYGEMLAAPLIASGHDVLIELTPIDFERILSFEPQVIVLGLYRKDTAFCKPISEAKTDVLGYQPLIEMESYPAVNSLPIMLIGHCLVEDEIPTKINYDIFMIFPRDISAYPKMVEYLAENIKKRRNISAYVCPNCRGRLTYLSNPADLFCPRCGTSVAIVEEKQCLYQTPGGVQRACELSDITAP